MFQQDQNHRAGNRFRQFLNTGVLKAKNDQTPQDSQDDQFQIKQHIDQKHVFGSFQPSLFTPPDQLNDQDPSKYNVRSWVSVIIANKVLPFSKRKQLYKRALKLLPYSYKIWKMYLEDYSQFIYTKPAYSKHCLQLNQTFQQSLQYLPKMPVIWLMYTQILQKQHLISKLRRTFNWALRNLPLTQHQKIWKQALQWAFGLQQKQTIKQMLLRYVQFNPDYKQQAASYLKSKGQLKVVCKLYQQILNDRGFNYKTKHKFDIFDQFIQVLAKQTDIIGYDVQSIIRQGMIQYKQAQGLLWTRLAQFHIRRGDFQNARQIYQQGLKKVQTANNFAIIFNAYTKFQQQTISALSNQKVLKQFGFTQKEFYIEVQKMLNRLQQLIQNRPILMAKLKINKNCNLIVQWYKLFNIYVSKQKIKQAVDIFNQSIQKIDHSKVMSGLLGQYYFNIAKNDIFNIKQKIQIFKKAINSQMVSNKDYQIVLCGLCQLLIKYKYFNDAKKVLVGILFSIPNSLSKNMQQMKKSAKLWSLYLDVQNQIGTFQSLKIGYEKCKQSKAINTYNLLKYGDLLWQNQLIQQTYRLYQWGTANIPWPAVNDIWIIYLQRFLQKCTRAGVKLQRARNLFQKVLKQCPIKLSKVFYIMYANFQQQFGLISMSLQIYQRLIQTCDTQNRMQNYLIYAAKIQKLLGITKARPVFQRALQGLKQRQIVKMSIFYGSLQQKLGQIQRARKVLQYGSQFTNPNDDLDQLWITWQKFQAVHGDKQTYKQYMRVRKVCQQKFLRFKPDIQAIIDKVQKGIV